MTGKRTICQSLVAQSAVRTVKGSPDAKCSSPVVHATPTANLPRFSFQASLNEEELLRQQCKGVIDDLAVCLGGWPDDEPIEEFLIALREWRGHQAGSRNDRAA